MKIHGAIPGRQGWPGYPNSVAPSDGAEDLWCERLDLRKALEGLPQENWNVADLLGQGCTEREMAERLGLTRGQLRVRRDATLRLLRRELAP